MCLQNIAAVCFPDFCLQETFFMSISVSIYTINTDTFISINQIYCQAKKYFGISCLSMQTNCLFHSIPSSFSCGINTHGKFKTTWKMQQQHLTSLLRVLKFNTGFFEKHWNERHFPNAKLKCLNKGEKNRPNAAFKNKTKGGETHTRYKQKRSKPDTIPDLAL